MKYQYYSSSAGVMNKSQQWILMILDRRDMYSIIEPE